MNSPPVRSRASLKFRANHPSEHRMFVDLVKNAKVTRSKFLWQREEEEVNCEFSNMLKNQANVKPRPADFEDSCKEKNTREASRKRSRLTKRVSWKQTLCEFRTFSDGFCDCEQETVGSIWTDLRENNNEDSSCSSSPDTPDTSNSLLRSQQCSWNNTLPDVVNQISETQKKIFELKTDESSRPSALPDLLERSLLDCTLPDLLQLWPKKRHSNDTTEDCCGIENGSFLRSIDVSRKKILDEGFDCVVSSVMINSHKMPRLEKQR